MAEKEYLLEIEDLHINFYTRAGVVKALDGVDLKIYKGETFGLVGETGCGKSVTANCILRLVPMPPGKIERGRIYLFRPREQSERRSYLSEQIDAEKKKGHQDKERLESLNNEMVVIDERSKLREKVDRLSKDPAVPQDDEELLEAIRRLNTLDDEFNLLNRSKEFMQKIRGKYVSMIFQEPMSALNPVFTVGFQISEVLLLHERKELAEAALRDLEEEYQYLRTHKHVKTVRNDKGEQECTNCRSIVQETVEKCPGCDNYLKSKPLKVIDLASLSSKRSKLKRVIENPNSYINKRIAKKPIKREALKRSERMLRLVRIPDTHTVIKAFPHELSGGMQQRVMIAMAMACKPQLLIADEPTTALDVTIQAQILKLMKELQEDTGTSILIITHNLGVVAEMCDRVGVMYAGVMAEVGPSGPLFKEPLHPYTQGLMNAIPKVNIDLPRLETIEGNVPNLLTPPSGCRFHPRCPYAMMVCRAQKPPMTEIRPGHFAACHLYTGVKQ